MKRTDDDTAAEARRTLERLRREAEREGPPPASGDDPAEVWARRTARLLSVVTVLGLIAWLNGLI